MLRDGTCCRGILQFYLHTHALIHEWNEPYLLLHSKPKLVLISRARRDGILNAFVSRQYRRHEMQTVVIDDRGVCLSVCLSASLSVCHAAQLGFAVQNGRTDQDVVWGKQRTLCWTGILISTARGRGVGENFATRGPTTYFKNGWSYRLDILVHIEVWEF